MRSACVPFVVALATSCAPKPQQPPPRTPPAVRTVAVVTQVPGARVHLDGAGNRTADAKGVATFPEVLASLTDTYVTATADGYEAYRQDAVRLPSGNAHVWLGTGCGMAAPSRCVNLPTVRKTFAPLPRLVTEGSHFRKDNGERFTAIETSDFALYQQFLAGEDLSPILAQRAELGFNLLRVFGSFNGSLGRFVPADFGEQWYAQLPPFAETAARHGLYVELTVFADATQWLPDPRQQIAHWNRTVAAVADSTNVLLEAGNELDQAINRLDSVGQLDMPATTISSHGSKGSQTHPVAGYWHYVTFHTNGAPEEQRKVGHDCMEIDPRPCLTNETSRYPDVGAWVGASLDRQKQLAYDSAAGAALLAAGSAFHSVAGRASMRMDPNTAAVAAAWVAGARSVPLACQDGPYVHRQDLEGSGYLRVYQRGSDPSCIVRIRR